ncbi:hypothetical protein XENOCAPTIV_020515 [Xenoophorus captivus]|uniref:Uncharacterized protein n=1 Tax=Xenoophorus captivus TaxID=1517983 RepID=A0ABV0RKC7_9TELE
MSTHGKSDNDHILELLALQEKRISQNELMFQQIIAQQKEQSGNLSKLGGMVYSLDQKVTPLLTPPASSGQEPISPAGWKSFRICYTLDSKSTKVCSLQETF